MHKRFGATEVLCDVSLAVRPGECVALIGPNGAGKSTLFAVASGQMAPSRGQVRLHGERIDGLAPHRIQRRGLARSFQISSLFGRLSAFENLRCASLRALGHGPTFWKRLSGLHDANARALELLELLGLGHRRDVPAQHLSHAEQRALDIGISVAGGGDVLLLDEPTAGMSRSETERFVPLIRRVAQGRTLVVVEHDMDVVFGLADRIAVLVQGGLAAFGDPPSVRADPRVQEAYLGPALRRGQG